MTAESEASQTLKPAEPAPPPLNWKTWIGWALTAVVSFHTAQTLGNGWLLIPCAYALIELSRASTNRKVFYPMLGVGFLFYAPQLGFFWGIFGPAAIALWLVLAFWIALFGLILRLVRVRFGNGWMLLLAPFIWTGLEYFRCELYYLRFGWLTFGMGFHATPEFIRGIGCFGLSFIVAVVAAALQWGYHPFKVWKLLLISAAAGISAALLFPALTLRSNEAQSRPHMSVAGVQLEFPSDQEVITGLDSAKSKFPRAELVMLSEYTFQEPVPQAIRSWCASNHVYLVVGGKEPLGETNFYDMAYVVGTNGDIVFMQGKSVPIQFFKDGRPAPDRKCWDSPWGKIGIPTCYDLSYTRVMDDFIKQGAVAILNPTMDIVEWGEHQHELHSRVAPVRAAEYGVPIFRVASSGISQVVSHRGHVLTKASFPGEGEIIGGELPLHTKPRLPIDRWLAPASTGIAAFALIASLIPPRKKKGAVPESPRSESKS